MRYVKHIRMIFFVFNEKKKESYQQINKRMNKQVQNRN